VSAAVEETLKGTRLLHRVSFTLCALLILVGLSPVLSRDSISSLRALEALDFQAYRATVKANLPEIIRGLGVTKSLMSQIEVKAEKFLTPQRSQFLANALGKFEADLIRRPPEWKVRLPKSGSKVGELFAYIHSQPNAEMLFPRLDELGDYIANAIVKYYGGPENEWHLLEIKRDVRAGIYKFAYQIYFSGRKGQAVSAEVKSDIIAVPGVDLFSWIKGMPGSARLVRAAGSKVIVFPELTGSGWTSIEGLTPTAAIQKLSVGRTELALGGVKIDSTLLLVASPLVLLGLQLYFFGYVRHLKRTWASAPSLTREFPWAPLFDGHFGRVATHLTTWLVTGSAVLALLVLASYTTATTIDWLVTMCAGALGTAVSFNAALTIDALRENVQAHSGDAAAE